MIIDSCIFNDELEMLEFRMRLLWDHVDKFVVVEADRTHSGKSKPFNFLHAQSEFGWARGKLFYFPLSIDVRDLNLDAVRPEKYEPDHPFWKIENRQRAAIIDACKYFSDNDILMLSDCDEIPSLLAVEFRTKNNLMYPMTCEQAIVPYGLDYHCDKIAWRGTIMCDLGYARQCGTQGLRNMRQQFSPLPQGGWHLSYFGGVDRIQSKIASFAHQELNRPEYTGSEYIKNCLEKGEGIFKNEDSSSIARTGKGFFPDYFLKLAPESWWIHKQE